MLDGLHFFLTVRVWISFVGGNWLVTVEQIF